ncbi:hypothetical protein C8R46DRAFT_1030419 [Mycena filopes]|nr:hypothetical protein C8R46DRAFT_1030419 [Mycena filopes]
MYIGGPTEAAQWERAIIGAGQDMMYARETLHEYTSGRRPVASFSAGLQYGGCRGDRPQNMHSCRPGDVEQIVAAELRHSRNIQTITSFQNATLKRIAPRVWDNAHGKLRALMQYDVGLHLAFDLPCQFGPRQPSAFSRVDYLFSTSGVPRLETGAYIPSLTAITSLGNYHASAEGHLILWADKKAVEFPVGSTVFLPPWMPYSFTAVQWPNYQMLVKQTCENALAEFVDNGLCGRFDVEELDEEIRRQEAADAGRLFSTMTEFDDQYERDLYSSTE